MEKWEYRTEIIFAHINNEGAREYLAKLYPKWKPSTCSPETMQVYLDGLGEKGWELVTMHSIPGSGKDKDVEYPVGRQSPTNIYSNAYFCVFKRRK